MHPSINATSDAPDKWMTVQGACEDLDQALMFIVREISSSGFADLPQVTMTPCCVNDDGDHHPYYSVSIAGRVDGKSHQQIHEQQESD
jgi:hypothetical protein